MPGPRPTDHHRHHPRAARCGVKGFTPLLLATALFAAISALWIVTDRRASERVYDEFSSANTSNSGLSQASAYLARRGRVTMLTTPIERKPIEANAVVFRVTRKVPIVFNPEELDEKQYGPPKPRERQLLTDEEEAFLRNGGRLVLAAQEGLLPWTESKTAKAEKVFPIWPGIDMLQLPHGRGFTLLRPRMHALFVAGEQVVV